MSLLAKIKKTLALLGLSETEISVYLDLLKSGNSSTSSVANRLELNRSTARYTLENLCKKRFAFQENRDDSFYFTAEDPEKILLLLKNEQSEIEEKENAVLDVMGDLKKLKKSHVDVPSFRFFEGVDGLIEMYEDVLKTSRKTKCDLYGYARLDYNETHPEFVKFLNEVYIPERERIGNKSFFIFNESESNMKYLENNEKVHRVSLLVPEDLFPFKTAFHIYDKKIAFSSQSKEEFPSGIIIEHSSMRDDHFSLFKMAWEVAKKLPINKHAKDISF